MKLCDMTVTDFVNTVSSDAPAPGGGSVAALAGSIGAALTAMVGNLTQGRKKYADYAEFAAQVEQKGNELKAQLLDVMDRDTDAFMLVSNAFSLPKSTDEEKATRSAAIQAGLKACTRTPMEMMELCAKAAQLAADFAENGFNNSSASDLGVAFLSLSAAIRGAWLNVLINISSIKDQAFADEYRARGQALLDSTLPLCDAGYEKVLGMVK